jgi:hypothetical protein
MIRTSPAIERLYVDIDLQPDSFATILPRLPLLANLTLRLASMTLPNAKSLVSLRDALALRDLCLDFTPLEIDFEPLDALLPALPTSMQTLALRGLGGWHPSHWVFILPTITELVASPSWCPKLESIDIDISDYTKHHDVGLNASYEDPDEDYSIGKYAIMAAVEGSEARKGVLHISFIE